MSCRLCLSLNEESFEIFGDKGQTLNVATLIAKHFCFHKKITRNDSFSQYICNSCWSAVDDFHNFYCDIENKHTNDDFLDKLLPHQFETKFLVTENDAPQETAVNTKCEIKTEDLNNELYFDENNEFDDNGTIKFDPDQTMSDDDNQCQKTANKIPVTTKRKAEKKPEKDAATMAKNKEIYEKCKKSSEWSEGQEKNIAQYCKMECFMCDDEVRFGKWLDMKRHYRSAHQMEGYVMCSCCNRKFVKRSKILDHVVRKLNPELFKCEMCGKCLLNRDSLRDHMGKHAPIKIRAYECTVCFKTFCMRSQFVEHQMHHLPDSEKKYVCTECEMRFTTDTQLKYHQRQNHKHLFHIICEQCGKDFSSNTACQRHIDIVHLNIPKPKAQCNICQNWYYVENLKKHMVSVHTIVPESERTCSTCGKISPNKKAMTSHIRVVHADRIHNCSVCDKSFKRATNLKEHMTTHTGEVLYNCPHCTKTFNSSANKHSHLKAAHRQQWEENRRGRKMN